MRNILCPLDFSKTSLNALNFACLLAEKFNAGNIHLLTIQNGLPESGIYSDVAFHLIETGNYQDAIEVAGLRAAKETNSHVPMSFQVLESKGKVSDEINRIASEGDFDLICMGTDGINNLKDKLLGSTTKNVLKKTSCNFLAVPKDSDYQNLQNIAIGMDFMYFDHERFDKIYPLLSALGQNLHIFDINIANNPLMTDRLEKIRKAVAIYPEVSCSLVDDMEVVSGILKFTRENPTDLIVLFTKNYGLVDRLFERSYTEKLILHSRVPVLALKTN